MPSTIGLSSLYSFDNLAKSAPLEPGAGERIAQLGMAADELVQMRLRAMLP